MYWSVFSKRVKYWKYFIAKVIPCPIKTFLNVHLFINSTSVRRNESRSGAKRQGNKKKKKNY